MCGITGRLNFRSGAPVDPDLLRDMCDLIAHRGPDDSGVFVDGPVGLGHRRLSIIDLSDGGHQPMTDDGRLWITFNGEIYNFQTLRPQLESRGHRFKSKSDTEVILAAYREWGVDCLAHLRGMFAFAIWDRAERTFFAARDRLGKKPLYYWLDREGLAFASEPKAFLADDRFEVRPNPVALSYYLSLQYVPSPLSAFSGVHKLPPAHYLLIRDGKMTVTRYWTLKYSPKRRISEADAAEETLSRLREATRLRLISDVPLGAFLSGGIDSGTVVALMAAEGGRVKTFSIGFEEPQYNELQFARLIAQRYGTDHHEFIVRPDAMTILPELVWHYNEPYADSSAIPTFYLAQLTRKSVTVALNGDAGDENFAGYERYRANALAAQYDRLPSIVRRMIANGAGRLPAPSSDRLLPRTQRFVASLSQPREQRYARWIMHFHGLLKDELITPEFAQAARDADALNWLSAWYGRSDAPDFVDATLDVDVNTYLPDDLLVKFDIASMAHSLEARSPFLDHEFMEFVASLPSHFKLRGWTTKFLLKRAVRDLLPATIIDRPKMGFGIPIDVWFRDDLRDFARDLLLGSAARQRGYLQHAVVERLINEHVSGARQWHDLLWNLMMFELWHQRFVDARPERPARTAGVVHRGTG
jgi:asparagine synthase (glutamine-hydrolysing)